MFAWEVAQEETHPIVPATFDAPLKWSWACRALATEGLEIGPGPDGAPPRVGDLVAVRVEKIGYHATIVTSDNRKLRIYPGDVLVGVFGHRYATDCYEGEVGGIESLSILTAGGMIGTVLSKHQEMAKPTEVSFVGYVTRPTGARVNLIAEQFHARAGEAAPRNLIVVVGTGMNAGKTTTASRLIHALAQSHLTVAACKLTGSVSNRDQDEMRAASARSVLDFSDYGFPSTYLAEKEDLHRLWNTMLLDGMAVDPDVTVMEIADGLLQRETSLILSDPGFRAKVRGVILAADSALAALQGVEKIRSMGYHVLAVSGAFTSAPLYVREFLSNGDVPVASSAGDGRELAQVVAPQLAPPTGPKGPERPMRRVTARIPIAVRPSPL